MAEPISVIGTGTRIKTAIISLPISLLIVSAVLLGKEVLAAVITFGQRIFGEKIRINVSRDLSLRVVDRILQFRMAFFSNEGNEPGKLQTRIDRGVMSLSNTVKNFFIDILPLFTSAVMALVLMFAANVYVGLVALAIIPIYFFLSIPWESTDYAIAALDGTTDAFPLKLHAVPGEYTIAFNAINTIRVQ